MNKKKSAFLQIASSLVQASTTNYQGQRAQSQVIALQGRSLGRGLKNYSILQSACHVYMPLPFVHLALLCQLYSLTSKHTFLQRLGHQRKFLCTRQEHLSVVEITHSDRSHNCIMGVLLMHAKLSPVDCDHSTEC